LLPIKFYKYFFLGYKKDKIDACLTGEYGLSRILLENGYKVTCLLYDNIDFNDQTIWNINNLVEPDRYLTFNGQNVPLTTIFIKNVWRWEGNYASLPVLYKECINFVNSKLNQVNIFDNYPNITNNYTLINVSDNGINYVDNKYNWTSKAEYYNLYGYAEETVVFPTNFISNKNCVIYAHYDSDNIIKDYILQGLKALIIAGYDILFFTSCERLNNVSVNILPFRIFFKPNMGVGTDWRSWLDGLKFIKDNKFSIKKLILSSSIIN
jgi:hypothetical protein